MPHVVLCSSDPVGERMAGPGIRYHRLAGELARSLDVTLVAPGDGPVGDVPYRFEPASRGVLGGVAADFVVAQRLPYRVVRELRARRTRLVFDLYVPSFVEAAAQLAEEPRAGSHRVLRYEETRRAQLVALTVGDAFICASERQRDFWLGALGAVGRIDPDRYDRDRALRGLIEIVPFGLDPAPTSPTGAVKGALQGISADDRLLLWGGGIWNWLDPLTVIRAVGLVAERRSDVRLLFMGTLHPSVAVEGMAMTARASALARELGLAGTHVLVNQGWVPFAERAAWFRDADLGVSAHHDTAEARFAFRTRLLDHLACGTPLVVTRGDVIADLVEARGLGRAVEPGDAEAFAAAVLELLDARALAAARAAVERERETFAWPTVADRLVTLLESCVQQPPRGGAVAAAGAATAAFRSSLTRRGLSGTIEAMGRAVSGGGRR